MESENSTSPRVKNSNSDLRHDLRKADKELMEALVSPVRDTAKEAKGIALSVKTEVGRWRNTKFGAIIGLVVILAGALAVFYNLKNKVENNEKAVIEYKADMTTVKADMAEVKIDIQEVKTIVGKNQKQEDKKDKKQIEEIKTVIEEALKARTKIRPSGRRGG